MNHSQQCTNVLLHQGPLSLSRLLLQKENIRFLHFTELKFTLKHNMRGNLRLRARKLISSEWKSTVTIR